MRNNHAPVASIAAWNSHTAPWVCVAPRPSWPPPRPPPSHCPQRRTPPSRATSTGHRDAHRRRRERHDHASARKAGHLTHNTSPGFESATDFDSTCRRPDADPSTATLTIDGGGGDDIIVGGPNLDTSRGGAGDDRLTGGPNNAAKPTKESISGGDGNDVMLWYNGDGNDINDGGDGADETQFNNGTADDAMSRGSARRAARTGSTASVRPSSIDIAASTERLNVNAFSGADTLTSPAGVTIPTTIDAGPGNDTITTGGGADMSRAARASTRSTAAPAATASSATPATTS